MDINSIKNRYQELSTELRQVLAKMERSDKVYARMVMECMISLIKMNVHIAARNLRGEII